MAHKEMESVDELLAHVDSGASLDGVVLQGLDLTGQFGVLEGVPLTGAVFLGCRLPEDLSLRAHQESAMVFPALPDVPYRTSLGRLYTADDLYAGFDPAEPESYADCFDARVYRHWEATGRATPPSIVETLARRLHDHAISDALDELLKPSSAPPPRVVAVMGGHAMGRDDPSFGRVARLAADLTRRGFTMASGGGPGAMEATNLGAYMAARSPSELADAIAHLATAPSYKDRRWLATAFEVRERYPLVDEVAGASLGVPTWLYGHEPPNPFATHIAKYFANSVREAGLVAIATHGIVFAPGGPGTIQEVFQDACQNHYETVGFPSPMVLLDRRFWTEERPVYSLLRTMAADKVWGDWLAITDDIDEAISIVARFARSRARTQPRPFSVRLIRDDDLPAIVHICKLTLLEHIRASGGDEAMLSEAFLRSTLDSTKSVVAESDGAVIGYLQYQIDAPTCVANGAAVLPQWQRRGVGRALLTHVTREAEAAACTRIVISVQPSNTAVHALYLAWGFVEGDNPSGWNQELSMPLAELIRKLED